MSVNLAKRSDVSPNFQPGAGAGHGGGEVKFIGGFPTERTAPRVRRTGRTNHVRGALVAVCGLRIDTRPVRFLDVGATDGTMWITADGSRVPARTDHTVGDWFRFLLDTGSFAGVAYYR